MRFIVFYAIREIRKKPMRFWATVLLIGAVLFCMTDLIVLLEGTEAARTLTHAGDLSYQEKDLFHSTSFILLLAAHTLLLLMSIAILTDSKLRHDAEELAILHDLGVTRLRMMLVQTVENISAFLTAILIGIPATLLLY